MTSILEPFASKRRPNETGTCSIYASVNVTKNVENNEGDIFTIKDDTVETTYNLKAPAVETNQFKIVASNTEIDKDNSNAVNKSYCDNNYIKNANPLRLDTVSASKITIRNTLGDNDINTVTYTRVENGQIVGETGIGINGLNCLKDRTILAKPLTVNSNAGIEFNVNSQGKAWNSSYPQGKLSNLVTSTITTAQLNTLSVQGLTDNVCPTYNYCQNNFIRNGASTVKFGGLEISNANDEFKFSLFSANNRKYLRILHNNSQFIYFRNDLVQIPTKLGIGYTGIQFNTSESGGKNTTLFPQGLLKNLVPSTITSDELASYAQYNIMDNVCPTYQYCENTYAKIGSGPDMTGYQKILKRKRLWNIAQRIFIKKLVKEEQTVFNTETIDVSDFPTPTEDDDFELWIRGTIEITKGKDSGSTTPLTVAGKGDGVAGLISLDFQINEKDISIPLNWSVIYANSDRVYISINTVGKVFASEVLTGKLPTTARIVYYSANYTNNPLIYELNLKVYATLITTI